MESCCCLNVGLLETKLFFNCLLEDYDLLFFFLNHWSKTNDSIAYNNLSVKVSPLASRSCRSATVICGSPSCWSTKNRLCSRARFLMIILWTTNFQTLCLAKLPSLVPQQVLCPVMQCGTRHRTVYAEITLFIWEQARKCHRKILGLVKSDVSVVPMFGKGITGRCTFRRASPASPSLSSETTSFMAASTRACTFTPGSERIIPETVESSVLSVSLKSNCCGAGR